MRFIPLFCVGFPERFFDHLPGHSSVVVAFFGISQKA